MQSENRSRLHALEKMPDPDEKACSIYRELTVMFKDKKHEAEQQINEILKKSYTDEYERLMDIPGVGKRLSSLVIGFFGEFENFKNAKQVSSFIGLNPSPRQSGVS